ncbi:S8 family serine peptidase [Clostridium vincentii]|nr:S8 family serine peptidase [Clostridium vincentii]
MKNIKKIGALFLGLYYILSLNINLANAKEIDVNNISNNESNKIIIKYKEPQEELKVNTDSSNSIKSIEKINEKVDIIDTNSSEDKKKVYDDLKSNPNIEKVEEDKLLKIEAVPNDPKYTSQWYIPNINFPKLWDYNIISKKNVTIAVIDSGINYNHEDLKGMILDGGYNFYNNSTDVYDDNGHGTGVAGIINANSNNSKGIVGLQSNMPIKILPLKTSDSNGWSYLSDMLRAVEYAIEKDVDVINLSMGSSYYSEIENEEIQKAINNGIVVVASAGNDGDSSYEYPASYDNVIAVGATDQNNNKAGFSNYNNKVSLSAPGQNILTTNLSGGYSYYSGTSFSTPIVSAMVAIIKSVRPDLSPQEIKSILQNNSLDLGTVGRDNYFGYGKVDAYKSISNVLAPQSIKIQQDNVNININETSLLTAIITPDDVIDKNIIWSSSNAGIAMVDQTGIVKGISMGDATITAKTKLGNLISIASVHIINSNVLSVKYQSHVEKIGWQNYVNDGKLAGTEGQELRMEALKINLENAPAGAKIKYQVHVKNIGWQDWVYDGKLAGTEGKALRVEGIRIVLENAPGYSIAYEAHVQNIGWQAWVYNGELSGTTGKGLRIEALKIKVVKSSDVPMGVSYSSHVQNIGWNQTVIDNELSGTQGQGFRMEALKINLRNAPEGAKIKYQAHVQNIGWQDWVYDGTLIGTQGRFLRVEGIKMVLENAPGYKIVYQVHVQNIGWQNWVYDGELAGTTAKSLRLEAIRIKIVKNS